MLKARPLPHKEPRPPAPKGAWRQGMNNKQFAKRFGKDLMHEIKEDNVATGAAGLAYYLMLSIFPAMLALLTILPYLPIANIDKEIMGLLNNALPGSAAKMFSGVVTEITTQKNGGLLSFGLLFTLWAASNGMAAIMQQLNVTYDVKEGRSFLKTRGIAFLLTFLFGALIVGAFTLVMFGGKIQELVTGAIGSSGIVLTGFQALRWGIIAGAIMLAFALTYFLGPDVEQKFKFVSPGSVLGVVLLVVMSLGFKLYVDSFGKYNATYGSIGAVIVFMLWLYCVGIVLLLGSEINALIEHYSDEGKNKGQKTEPTGKARHLRPA